MDAEGEVWYKKDGDEDRFLHGRAGDQFLCTFQCDLCVFRTLQRRDPIASSSADDFMLECIRRVNLDALWAREPGTVSGNLSKIREVIRVTDSLGMSKPPLADCGPFPDEDLMGYGVAVIMVRASLDKGVYEDYKQMRTIRKIRTVVSNQWETSLVAGTRTLGLASEDRKKVSTLSSCPTNSRWFKRFIEGCSVRMGEVVKQDKALSRELLHAVLEECKSRMVHQTGEAQALTISVATYLVVCFCASLRGNEGFMLCLGSLRKYLDQGKTGDKNDHVILPLLGRFKNESGERLHLIPLPSTTESGFSPRWWLELLVHVRERQGITDGPAFCWKYKKVAKMKYYENVFHDVLEVVQEGCPDLFVKDISVREDYGLNRSLRRGATTLATLLKVAQSIVDAMNRWRAVENARGRRPTLPMREHYAEILMLVPLLIQYSKGF